MQQPISFREPSQYMYTADMVAYPYYSASLTFAAASDIFQTSTVLDQTYSALKWNSGI